MDVAALAISICAFLVSGAAFGWTIYEWHRSGARLNVEVTSFIMLGGGMSMFQEEPRRWMIAFDVANSGRTTTSVTAVGFQRSGKGAGVIVMSEPAAGPNPLPKRLDPGESFMYPVDIEELLDECQQHGIDYRALKPYATSGHGRFHGRWAKVGLNVVATRGMMRDYPSSAHGD